MCINCIQSMYPDKEVVYQDYNGPQIHVSDFNDDTGCFDDDKFVQFFKNNFDGAEPYFIDCSLIGTYKIIDKEI